MAKIHRGFENIDRDAEQAEFFKFLDLSAQHPTIHRIRDRMLEISPLKDGDAVLDVGCGLGHETNRLASLVGKNGQAVGVDSSEKMIAEAIRRAADLKAPVEYQKGDAQDLPFDDGYFDQCRAEKVLLYLDDPSEAIAEMARITRTGGSVMIFDFDYGGWFIDSDFTNLARNIETLVKSDPRNPLIGRFLPHFMRQAGLNVEVIEPMTVAASLPLVRRIYASLLTRAIDEGVLSAEEVEVWWREQETMDQEGTFYHAAPGYIVAANKP